MATVNSGIREDANFLNLKEIAQKQVKSEVNNMLVTGENIIQCFQTVRDQVVFTDKRVIVVNVQGITGKKTSYFSYPYSKVLYFGIETAGVLDIDSELIMTFEMERFFSLFQIKSRHQRNLFKYTAVYFYKIDF